MGDIIDVHDYVEPRSPGARYNRAAVLGEYGGLGYKVHPCVCCCTQEGPQRQAAGHALGDAVWYGRLRDTLHVAERRPACSPMQACSGHATS